jgi:hypothetical protein
MKSPDPAAIWALFQSDPPNFILMFVAVIVFFGGGAWWLRGFIHKEKEKTFDHRLKLAQENQQSLTSKLDAAGAKILELQAQISAGAQRKELTATVKSSVDLFADVKAANVELQTSLSPQTSFATGKFKVIPGSATQRSDNSPAGPPDQKPWTWW